MTNANSPRRDEVREPTDQEMSGYDAEARRQGRIKEAARVAVNPCSEEAVEVQSRRRRFDRVDGRVILTLRDWSRPEEFEETGWRIEASASEWKKALVAAIEDSESTEFPG